MNITLVVLSITAIVLTVLLTIAVMIHLRWIYQEIKDEVFDVLDNRYIFKDVPSAQLNQEDAEGNDENLI